MPAQEHPVILFDGVCNLCNSAVAWIIDRDRNATFRFASLQSLAAKQLLDQAAPFQRLPDSIVLIDARGVRTRSDAALGIAAHLGFPYSLAALARILPRFLRDRAYDRVARNRYSWFGRRDACMMPSPGLAARFLDAAEPRADAAPPASPAPETAPPRILSSLAIRAIILYLFLAFFPFPIGAIPLTESIAGWYTDARQPLSQWVARSLFHLDAVVQPTGSGDTAFAYTDAFINLAIALTTAALWTASARGKPVARRIIDASRTYLRFCLGATMLLYGFSKVFPVQFPLPGPDRLLIPFADTSPMGLLWAFMGASTPYQIFGGAMEVIGGILLFWRRTTLLGALISAGVLANVVALNFCYDVPVKLFSSTLLFTSIFLIAPDIPRLAGVLLFNLPAQPATLTPFPPRRLLTSRARLALKTLAVLLCTALPIMQGYSRYAAEGPDAPRTELHGIYSVETFTRDDAPADIPQHHRWLRVGINRVDKTPSGVASILRADGSASRLAIAVDNDARTITFRRRGEDPIATLSFSRPDENTLLLQGNADGANITASLRRLPPDQTVLMGRGFRWIQEFPYNR